MIWMSRGLHQRRPICRKDAGVAPSRYQCFYVTLFLNDGLQEGGQPICVAVFSARAEGNVILTICLTTTRADESVFICYRSQSTFLMAMTVVGRLPTI